MGFVYIKGQLTDTGDGSTEIIRLRSLLDKRNARIRTLRARVAELEKGYAEAIEDIESWAAYASDYFIEKHDLAGCLAGHRAALQPDGEGSELDATKVFSGCHVATGSDLDIRIRMELAQREAALKQGGGVASVPFATEIPAEQLGADVLAVQQETDRCVAKALTQEEADQCEHKIEVHDLRKPDVFIHCGICGCNLRTIFSDDRERPWGEG